MHRLLSPALWGAAVLFVCSPAGADPPSSPEAPPPDAPSAAAVDAWPPTLGVDEMSAIRGGDGVSLQVLSSQQLTATSSGNVVNAGSLSSGPVNFSPEALSGFTGVGNFVINTGANNTLQGAINVSIGTAPTP